MKAIREVPAKTIRAVLAGRRAVSCMKCGIGYYIKRQRKNDGSHFYGCSRFPKCRSAVDEEIIPFLLRWYAQIHIPEAPSRKLTPSEVEMIRRVVRIGIHP